MATVVTVNVNNLSVVANRTKTLLSGIRGTDYNQANGSFAITYPLENSVVIYPMNPNGNNFEIPSDINDFSLSLPLDTKFDFVRNTLWIADFLNNRVVNINAIDGKLLCASKINIQPYVIYPNINTGGVFVKNLISETESSIIYIDSAGNKISEIVYPSTNNLYTLDELWIKELDNTDSISYDHNRLKIWWVSDNIVYMADETTKTMTSLDLSISNFYNASSIVVHNESGNVFVISNNGENNSYILQINSNNTKILESAYGKTLTDMASSSSSMSELSESDQSESNQSESEQSESDQSFFSESKSSQSNSSNSESQQSESTESESYLKSWWYSQSDISESDRGESDRSESDRSESERSTSSMSELSESDQSESNQSESDQSESWNSNQSESTESDKEQSDSTESESYLKSIWYSQSDRSESDQSESDRSESEMSESSEWFNPNIYFAPHYADQVLRVEAGSDTTSRVGSLYSGVGKYTQSAQYESKVVFSPGYAEQILVLDTSDNTTFLTGPIMSGVKYSGVCNNGGVMYFSPNSIDYIGVYDSVLNTFSTLGNYLDPGVGNILNPKFGQCAIYGDYIYFVPNNYHQALACNINTGNWFLFGDVNTDKNKWWACTRVGKYIYGTPHKNLNILKIDCENFTTSLISSPHITAISQYLLGCASVGTNVYFSPLEATRILKLDTLTDTTSLVGDTYVGSVKYGGAIAAGTDIYFSPFYANRVLKLDTLTDTTSLIGDTYTGHAKWY